MSLFSTRMYARSPKQEKLTFEECFQVQSVTLHNEMANLVINYKEMIKCLTWLKSNNLDSEIPEM